MGRLVPYAAAMNRVLKGLECVELLHDEECDSSEDEGFRGSQEQSAPARAAAAEENKRNRLCRLAAEFGRATGAPIAPDELEAKCKAPDGEFYLLKHQVNDTVIAFCERSGDWSPLDELEDGHFDEALASAARRASAGLSAAELKKARTLPMLILKVAHRRATRLRAASGKGGKAK